MFSSLVFIDDMTVDKSRSMNSDTVLGYTSNAPNPTGQSFTVQMDPKHSLKATQDLFKVKKYNTVQWPRQSPDPNPIVHAFHLLKTKRPKDMQELRTAARPVRTSPEKKSNDWWCLWAPNVRQNGFPTQNYEGKWNFWLLVCPFTFGSLWRGVCTYKNAVIPTPFTQFGNK